MVSSIARGGGPLYWCHRQLRGPGRTCWGHRHPLDWQRRLRGLMLRAGPGTGTAQSSSEGPGYEGHLLSVVTQLPRYRSLQLRPGLVERPQPGLQGPSVLWEAGTHVVIVFLLFKPPEVVLDQEGGVELAHCNLLLEH